jgi:hypothetical protein
MVQLMAVLAIIKAFLGPVLSAAANYATELLFAAVLLVFALVVVASPKWERPVILVGMPAAFVAGAFAYRRFFPSKP